MKNLIKIIALFFCFTSIVQANDSAGTTAAGGITFVKTSAVVMQSENLIISPEQVQVNYLFKNITQQDVTTQVLFPLPPYQMLGANASWDDEVGAYKGAPFKNFAVIVNNKPVKFAISSRAILQNKDITPILKKYGIPLNTDMAAGQIPMPEDQYAKVSQWHKELQQLGFLDKKGYPRWQKQVTYYWTQTFPANSTISIQHTYRPSRGAFFTAGMPQQTDQQLITETKQRTLDLFKLNMDSLQNETIFINWLRNQITRPTKSAYDVRALFYNVDYILTTGANWAGPIKQFTLILQYPKNGAVAYNTFYQQKPMAITNMPGELKIQLQDFTPKKDLRILFGVPN